MAGKNGTPIGKYLLQMEFELRASGLPCYMTPGHSIYIGHKDGAMRRCCVGGGSLGRRAWSLEELDITVELSRLPPVLPISPQFLPCSPGASAPPSQVFSHSCLSYQARNEDDPEPNVPNLMNNLVCARRNSYIFSISLSPLHPSAFDPIKT